MSYTIIEDELWVNLINRFCPMPIIAAFPYKTEVCIYDYVDRNSPTLMRMFYKRLRGYRAMGYEPPDTAESAKMMFELP